VLKIQFLTSTKISVIHFSCYQKCRVQHVAGGGGRRSCDWSTQFLKVIQLGLSLVRIRQVLQYSCTETGVQLIQAKCVHHKCVQVMYRSAVHLYKLCSITVHESIYIKCNVCVCSGGTSTGADVAGCVYFK
jgi:hypothetical protein